MKEISEEIIDMIIFNLKTAPDSQISENIRKNLIEFSSNKLSDKYDLLVKISKNKLTDISSFVKKLCELDKYYLKPE